MPGKSASPARWRQMRHFRFRPLSIARICRALVPSAASKRLTSLFVVVVVALETVIVVISGVFLGASSIQAGTSAAQSRHCDRLCASGCHQPIEPVAPSRDHNHGSGRIRIRMRMRRRRRSGSRIRSGFGLGFCDPPDLPRRLHARDLLRQAQLSLDLISFRFI